MDDEQQTTGAGAPAADATYQWAPAPPRRRRLGLWIGTPAGLVVAGLVAASLVLIAPGTAIAGVSVGGMTAGAAAATIQAKLDDTSITLTGDNVHATLTGSELGAAVDAKALADDAFTAHPMWNLAAWFSGTRPAPLTLDAAKAEAALHKAAPALYRDATDATVSFDAATGSYVATPAVDGTGVDLGAVTTALRTAFAKGENAVTIPATATPAKPAIGTDAAQKTVASLNTMLSTAGFYVGDERTVPLDRAFVANWLTVAPSGDAFTVTADTAAIQKSVDQLPSLVNRAPQNGTEITDPQGNVLRVDTATLDGRTLGDTAGVAAGFAKQLAAGDGVYKLTVSTAAATTTTLARSMVVNLGNQTTYLYENGQLIDSYLVSTGMPATPTATGSYKIFAKVALQDMGCYPGADYCTKDVPWVSYFYPDVGFHGAYWHHNFGHVMSHGCVNMPVDVAEFVYNWAPIGTPVTVTN